MEVFGRLLGAGQTIEQGRDLRAVQQAVVIRGAQHANAVATDGVTHHQRGVRRKHRHMPAHVPARHA